jgi:hypothetical protein
MKKKMFVDKHQACGAHDIKGSKRIEGLEIFFDLLFFEKKNIRTRHMAQTSSGTAEESWFNIILPSPGRK